MAFSLFGSRRTAQLTPAPAPAPAPTTAPAPDDKKADDLSPLAQVADAWKMKAPDASAAPAGPQAYFGNVDSAKLAAAAKAMNFTANIDPAVMERAKGGDSDALTAVINSASQNAFQTAMAAIPAIMEPVLQQVEQKSTAAVPGLFRQMQLRNERPNNPIYNDPAWVPVIEALKTSLASQNPQATSDQIVRKAEEHVDAMVAAAAKQKHSAQPNSRQQSAADESDFSFLLNSR